MLESPPETPDIPPSASMGADAVAWLSSCGFVPRTPPIRSSDYELCLRNPFLYYLTRRLGLVPALRFSTALSDGSWFHAAHEAHVRGTNLEARWEERHREIIEACRNLGIIGDKRKEAVERERQSFLCAKAWYAASRKVPLSERVPFWWSLLEQPYIHSLGTELRCVIKDKELSRCTLVAQFDQLIYNERNNLIYIVDLKTTSGSPRARLQTCPIEFQAQHYIHVLEAAVRKGLLASDAPLAAGVGGILHIAIRKPSIRFGLKDRPFRIEERTITRGPRKGAVVQEKKYYGEPSFDHYLSRCEDWYLARGDYVDLEGEWRADPPVNVSYTLLSGQAADEDWREEYRNRLKEIERYATQHAQPKSFPKSIRGLYLPGGDLSEYADFFLSKPSAWPSIIREKGFVVVDRDADLAEDCEDSLQPV